MARYPARANGRGFSSPRFMRIARLFVLLLVGGFLAGCDRSSASREVVLYTAVDEPIARLIVDDFTRRTGIRVVLKTDTEVSKTAGLV